MRARGRGLLQAIPSAWRQAPLQRSAVGWQPRRSVQFSADDRIPAQTLPDRVVRFYDREKGLSRSMDEDAEEACRLAEKQLQLKDVTLQKWVKWEPPKENVLRFRSSEYVNFHAGDELSNKLTRKVAVIFNPYDLELSDKATANLIAICGARFNPNKKLIKMTSDQKPLQEQNMQRLTSMVGQLVYYSKLAAGEQVEYEPAPEVEAAPAGKKAENKATKADKPKAAKPAAAAAAAEGGGVPEAPMEGGGKDEGAGGAAEAEAGEVEGEKRSG